MINVCQWRRSIGLFRGRMACPAAKQITVVLSKKRSVLKVGLVCFVSLLTLVLLLARDMERNPDPKKKRGELAKAGVFDYQ